MKRKIKQVWVPYWQWEDFQNGMWRKLTKDEESYFLQKAIDFTSNWKDYGQAMIEVIEAWPYTMLNSLTSPSTNKRAFIGHCACSYKHDLPEYIVRQAWKEITEQQRNDADEIAELVYLEWLEKHEKENRTICRDLEGSVLL